MKRLALLLCLVVAAFRMESAAQNYAPAVNYGTQLQPLGVATGDFNGDGNPDVIVTNFASSSLSFYPGNGDGTLGVPASVVVGAHPVSIKAADFNGDGLLDVAVSLSDSQSFQVLFGNGNGTFQPPITIAVPGLTSFDTLGQIVAADLNGDHRPDLVIATSRGAAVFMNSGTGNFSETSNLDPGQQISSVAIADVNHDGRPDVIGAESGSDPSGNPSGNIFFAAGNGDGSFTAILSVYQFVGTPEALVVGDMSNDGLLDIVVANSGGTLGGGGGGFGGGCGDIRICPPVNDPPPPQPITVPGSVLVLLQGSDGSFTLGNNLLTDPSPSDLLLGDFNGDGTLDIADASGSSPAIMLFLGQGAGKFAAPISLQLPFRAAQIAAGALTNANALDLAATDPGGSLLSVFVNRGANTLTLSSSPNPSGVSQSVALTATVHPKFPGTANNSGSVIFADGNQTLGTAPVNASGTSNLTTSFTSAGTHSILAVFSGSAALVGGSSARINQTVNRGQPTVALTSSPNPGSFGQAIAFNIAVSSGGTGPLPTGTVNLMNGTSILLSGSLDSAGGLSLSTSTLPIGTTTLVAQYLGDQNYTASSSAPLTQTIAKGNASVTASSSINPSIFGQAASLVVHVTSSSGGSTIPTGTVTLLDGTSSQASLPLDASGAASFSLATLNAGTHSLSANYSGDTSFNASSSTPVSQVISKSDTGTSLVTAPSQSTFGQAVQITATVQASGGGAGTPSGSVAFSDGANSLGSAVLTNGKAALSTSALGVGSHILSATYSGDSNFNSSNASGANGVTQAVAKSATNTSITGSPNPSAFGQAVVLNATVTAPSGGSGSPTGTVTFSDGSVSLGTATLATGAASLSVSSLSPGSHSITASYSGDGNFSASTSAAISQTVNKSSTTTSAVATPNPSSFGQGVSFAINVAASTGGTGIPTGTVALTEGASSLGSVALDVNGKASLTVVSLSVGSHTITASYVGDGNFQSSSVTVSQTVNKAASSTALSSSPNPSAFGQAVALTATVTAAGGAVGIPTGNVSFADGTTVLGSAALDASGKAVFNTTALLAGAHSITANYAGDSNFAPSTATGASSVSQVVNQSSTVTSLLSSANPSVFGQAVILTATVVASSGIGIPSGAIAFNDGAASLGSATLDSTGKAAITLNSLGAGIHSITAAYAGSTNYIASTSSPLVQTVSKNSVTIALSSAPNPSAFGQAVNFAIQVSAQSAGGAVAAIPSGNVSLNDEATNLGTVKLDNTGAAILTAPSLTAGTHVITASYTGDTNFTGGSSNAYSQVVNKALTATSLASSVNPATVATAVTLSATVTAGAGIPSGTINFFDGTQQIGSAPLDSTGKSALPIANLSAGSHSFTAAYSGNSNFGASLSAALNETVVDSHSSVVLTSSANPQLTGQPVTFVAMVTPALGGKLNSGVVIFSDGAQQLGAIPVVNSLASFTTTTLAAGSHKISASYQSASAPGPFDGTSATLTEVINPPAVGNKDFTMSIQQPLADIGSGQRFTTRLVLTPVNGLTGLERSVCLGAPRGAVCTITPERAIFNGKTSIVANITITTSKIGYPNIGPGGQSGPTGEPLRPSRPSRPLGAALRLSSLLAFGCVFFGGFKKRRMSLMAVALFAGTLTGCGSAGHAMPAPAGTPPGTYTMTVQTRSGSIVHFKQIELIVR